jgi:hypothetical protein
MPGEPITQVTPPEAPSGVPVPMVPRGVASAQVSHVVPIVQPGA